MNEWMNYAVRAALSLISRRSAVCHNYCQENKVFNGQSGGPGEGDRGGRGLLGEQNRKLVYQLTGDW